MQYGLYFWMCVGVGLLWALGTAVVLAFVVDLREKLGKR